MNKVRFKTLSLEHAKNQLGDEQFRKNKTAVTAIREDYEAGYSAGWKDNTNIFELEQERFKWSFETFPDSTALSSLKKLASEIKEIESDIVLGVRNPIEYADALMCLFDSAARQKEPISPWEIFEAFAQKLEINKGRTWIKNDDNSYSHQKPAAKTLQELAPLGNGKPIAYICGKVTGLPYEETFAKFLKRQLELESRGYYVINPMRLVHPDANWDDAMKICLSFLPYSDFVSLLHDWQDSKGATIEKEIFDRLGIEALQSFEYFD